MRQWLIILGLFSLLASLGTWLLDLTGLVEDCIYCRTERTMIGVLGILMLVPLLSYLRAYLAYVFGFYGAHTAAAQVFMNIEHQHFFTMMVILATMALFWIIFQVCILHWYAFLLLKKRRNNT